MNFTAGQTVRLAVPADGHMKRGLGVGAVGIVHAGPDKRTGMYVVWFAHAGQFWCDPGSLVLVDHNQPVADVVTHRDEHVAVPRETLRQAHDFVASVIHWSGGDRRLLQKLEALLKLPSA